MGLIALTCPREWAQEASLIKLVIKVFVLPRLRSPGKRESGGYNCLESGGWLSEQHSGEWGLIALAGCVKASQRTGVEGKAALASDVQALP